MKTSFLVMLLVVGGINQAAANWGRNPKFDNYFTVKEQPTLRQEDVSLDPLEVIQSALESASVEELKVQIYSLLNFEFHNERYGYTNEPYNRKKHFGGWVNDPRDHDCYNTRAKVLMRDSLRPVDFASNGCTVVRGHWEDPYAGRDYTYASDIQIDHFVPLKNAYISGAYKWNQTKRCLYGNFLGNDYHLLSVLGDENQTKSDKTPEEYMPPNRAYACQYLAQWLKVKLIWTLGLTPPEKDKVIELARQNNCKSTDFEFSAQELSQQRRFMADNMDLCQ
ncbi:HNH endonuclease family protein [Bdellovibrio reynosensis]|uniref:HNH endonuclease family protein n=1 Tax=Bdellovibrio reynosensis TaxID=2835041 RepID=A0ABY4C9H0_9BACT|nr:HNH endonuclease family protein [Bdellovibrio reynosensis]UOF01575.1 HNH endonuclease family protein [Bdellovibrio reynosensis]